ncbi:hypothetical protein LX32DRAFT_232563 [Colletotrichum zoysiae]|uniref:Uncharacterized protein n=1 Tax=Colletotrichum zoysiae TaxID=1216348 RepID=A0AAD9H3G8_9PEZI|nr:hypothetical protein LX32DRAFT_232563 [Colletotrichum zoysiae]
MHTHRKTRQELVYRRLETQLAARFWRRTRPATTTRPLRGSRCGYIPPTLQTNLLSFYSSYYSSFLWLSPAWLV